MNYKESLLNTITEFKEFEDEDYKPTQMKLKAYDLCYQILVTRFNNELKQYNNDKNKAFDKFISEKNLNYLTLYVEEFLLLDKPEDQIEFYKSVRKEMRRVINVLWDVVNRRN